MSKKTNKAQVYSSVDVLDKLFNKLMSDSPQVGISATFAQIRHAAQDKQVRTELLFHLLSYLDSMASESAGSDRAIVDAVKIYSILILALEEDIEGIANMVRSRNYQNDIKTLQNMTASKQSVSLGSSDSTASAQHSLVYKKLAIVLAKYAFKLASCFRLFKFEITSLDKLQMLELLLESDIHFYLDIHKSRIVALDACAQEAYYILSDTIVSLFNKCVEQFMLPSVQTDRSVLEDNDLSTDIEPEEQFFSRVLGMEEQKFKDWYENYGRFISVKKRLSCLKQIASQTVKLSTVPEVNRKIELRYNQISKKLKQDAIQNDRRLQCQRQVVDLASNIVRQAPIQRLKSKLAMLQEQD